MNQPYVKQYDANGALLNPIKENFYGSPFKNRETRRDSKKFRFHSNRKGISLTTTATEKFHRRTQVVWNQKKEKYILIEHYIKSRTV